MANIKKQRMKKIFFTGLCSLLSVLIYAQDTTVAEDFIFDNEEIQKDIDSATSGIISSDTLIKGDSGNVENGKPDMEKTVMDAINRSTSSTDLNKKFKGHYIGFAIGVNDFLTPEYSNHLPAGQSFMQLHNTSLSVQINFFQHSIGLIKDHLGLVTGAGLEYNNFYFRNDNSIMLSIDNQLLERRLAESFKVTKSKLTVSYISIPLFVEFQPGKVKRSNRMYFSAGIIGGYLINSHTKLMYENNNVKQKGKEYSDYNINSYRYGFVGRIGYGLLNVTGTYYNNSFFTGQDDPELYLFSVCLGVQL